MPISAIGWARPAGKWHIFADQVSPHRGRVSVCQRVGLGRIKSLVNAPGTDRTCSECVAWNKRRQKGR